MTKWKDLLDANPEPSLLDAINYAIDLAEKKDTHGLRNLQEFLESWLENYDLSVADAPDPKGDDQ
jgi:hypothetical protein